MSHVTSYKKTTNQPANLFIAKMIMAMIIKMIAIVVIIPAPINIPIFSSVSSCVGFDVVKISVGFGTDVIPGGSGLFVGTGDERVVVGMIGCVKIVCGIVAEEFTSVGGIATVVCLFWNRGDISSNETGS